MPAHNRHTPPAQLAGRGRKAPRVSLTLTEQEARSLRALAQRQGYSVSELIRRAVGLWAMEREDRWP